MALQTIKRNVFADFRGRQSCLNEIGAGERWPLSVQTYSCDCPRLKAPIRLGGAPDSGHNQPMFVLFATFAAAIGGFLFGYDTAVINGANTYLKSHFMLSPGQEGLAGSSAILGCIPGAMFAGFLRDRFGRKKGRQRQAPFPSGNPG